MLFYQKIRFYSQKNHLPRVEKRKRISTAFLVHNTSQKKDRKNRPFLLVEVSGLDIPINGPLSVSRILARLTNRSVSVSRPQYLTKKRPEKPAFFIGGDFFIFYGKQYIFICF